MSKNNIIFVEPAIKLGEGMLNNPSAAATSQTIRGEEELLCKKKLDPIFLFMI
jgi:hypothetical protein